MSLIVEPDDGIGPVVSAIHRAKTSIDIGIFRLDRGDIAKALRAAATRGVRVRTLIANTNRGGAGRLRQLEQDLLKTGASVRRTDDDLRRYHNKMMIVDRTTLYVLGFNYTALDVDKSRSFGIVTKKRALVQEALRLFEADSLRQPYTPRLKAFVVSPVNARAGLAAFLKGARKQLLVYDPKLTDAAMIRILHERLSVGVSVRILGKLGKRGVGLSAERFPGKRLHVRAIVRDGAQAFVGSQGLRQLELDGRREVGLIVTDRKVVARMTAVFEADWSLTQTAQKDVKDAKKEMKAEAKVDAQVEAQVEADSKIDAKTQAKLDHRLEADSRAAVKAEAKADKADAKAEAKVDARVEKQIEADNKAKAKALAKADDRVEADARAAVKAEAKADKADAKAEAKVDAQVEAQVEADNKAEEKAEAKVEARTQGGRQGRGPSRRRGRGADCSRRQGWKQS